MPNDPKKLYRMTYERTSECSFWVIADDVDGAKAAGKNELDYGSQEWDPVDRRPEVVDITERPSLPTNEVMWVQVEDHPEGGYEADAVTVAAILRGES